VRGFCQEWRGESIPAIVKQARKIVLVRTDGAWIAERYLTNHVDAASCGDKVGPEVLFDLHHGVQTEAVDGVVGDELTDPGLVAFGHGVVLGAKIRERDLGGRQPALFDVGLGNYVSEGTIRC